MVSFEHIDLSDDRQYMSACLMLLNEIKDKWDAKDKPVKFHFDKELYH